MKRVLIGLMVLTLALSLTGAAYAVTVPKSVCLFMNGWGNTLHLLLKPAGVAKASNGNVKMYSITGNEHFGAAYSFPVTGTAYVSPGTTIVQASITGSFRSGGELYTSVENVQWDYAATTNPVGTVWHRNIPDAVLANQIFTLNLVDCTTDPIPFSAEDEAIPEQLINP
jgi:hypothetical protein